MTEEDEEFERLRREIKLRQANCQHRWEESKFGNKYWAPGTYQYTCVRCGKMNMGASASKPTREWRVAPEKFR